MASEEEEEEEGEQLVKLEFRLFDGTNVSPRKYAMKTTIATIKENIQEGELVFLLPWHWCWGEFFWFTVVVSCMEGEGKHVSVV